MRRKALRINAVPRPLGRRTDQNADAFEPPKRVELQLLLVESACCVPAPHFLVLSMGLPDSLIGNFIDNQRIDPVLIVNGWRAGGPAEDSTSSYGLPKTSSTKSTNFLNAEVPSDIAGPVSGPPPAHH